MHLHFDFLKYVIYYTTTSLILLMQCACSIIATDVLLWHNRSCNRNRQICPVLPFISLLTRSKIGFSVLSLYFCLFGSVNKPVGL